MTAQFDPADVFFRCVEGCNEAIMLTDGDGVLTYVNPAWSEIYGYTREEAIGQTPKLLQSGLQAEEFYREMWDAIRDPVRASWRGELVNRSKDGRLVPVLLTITPYRSGDGKVLGYMGIALDMSKSKELEAAVAQQDRLASIGLLASGLAHEVGTPLGVIRGRAEMLLLHSQAQGNDSAGSKSLEVIVSQIDRISKLIRSLLRLSRATTDLNVNTHPVGDVAQEVLGLLGQALHAERIDVRVQIAPDCRARFDFTRLEQVILNLVMNAIHAIGEARKAGRDSHELTLLARPADGGVAVDVSDDGCGISAANMKKLFRPFFTTKDVGQGTGLGLAICARLMQEMNGSISVRSEPGKGTTFSLLLPI